ncbi:MAG: hypothetical protein WC437_04855 [Patescibacteria group bacterium]|jgi:hypothetical protein
MPKRKLTIPQIVKIAVDTAFAIATDKGAEMGLTDNLTFYEQAQLAVTNTIDAIAHIQKGKHVYEEPTFVYTDEDMEFVDSLEEIH